MELLIDLFRALKGLFRPKPAAPPPAPGRGSDAPEPGADDPLLRHKRAVEKADPAEIARALKRMMRKG